MGNSWLVVLFCFNNHSDGIRTKGSHSFTKQQIKADKELQFLLLINISSWRAQLPTCDWAFDPVPIQMSDDSGPLNDKMV